MTQTHDMLAATVAAAAGLAVGLGSVLAMKFARGDRPGQTDERPHAPVVQAYRYCPDEQRTRAAVLHSDGSAHCSDCNAHIPSTDPVKGGH
ncbi:hypothetical protein [Actinacidiphila rubida]|uniref:Uncharacterized protein n=1 Tax=Actinacidiphila rubida TaxID=310780 RepID=A0A1H8SWC2_9ACTN|nr:hypothetical protein [Actinacidiphila rubida]SEO82961.1 hypothetical protein SAMN05216267_104617 [Actinacidiphila rubida]